MDETENPKVSDYKLNLDIEKYKRQGLDEKTAIIVACAVNNCPQKANSILCELGDEQAELKKCLNDMIELNQQYFKDLEVVVQEQENDEFPRKYISDDNIEDVKNENSNIEC